LIFLKETLHGIGDLRISIKEGAQSIQLICSNAIANTYTPEELNEWLTPFGTSDASRSSGGSGIGLSQTTTFLSRVVFRVIRKSASDALVGCFFGLGCYFLDTSLKLEFDTLKTVRN